VSNGQLLSINTYHYPKGGSEMVYFAHAALMERHGWTNSFYAMHHKENLPCVDSRYFAEHISFGASAPLREKAAAAARIIYSREARAKLARLIDTRRIDVAHVHNIYHHLSPSVLVELKRRGIPLVMTVHDLKLACPAYTMRNGSGVCERCKGGRVWNVAIHRCIKGSAALSGLIMVESAIHKALRIYARHIDRIVTPSAFYREKLIEWGWPPDKLVHIRNFVPDAPPPAATPGGDHVLYFGRLTPEKGIATLIKAAAASSIPVRIAGTGPQEAELRALAKSLGAPAIFAGFLKGDALWAEVDAARAVVLPSEWYENSPMSVVEAFQRGKPLVGARIGGIPELIEEGRTGWSFRAGDVADLARALAVARETPDTQLASMSAACQELVSRNYSEHAYFEAMSALYKKLLV
jgi:glycosyltransferase involved in cell wall biosynthesis